MIRIAIADDHQLVLDGLESLLNNCRGLEVVVSAYNGYDLLAKLGNLKVLPDIILLDLEMPGPNQGRTIADLRQKYEELKVLVVTSHTTPMNIITAFRQGANGYVSKGMSLTELEKAMRQVIKTGHYLCPVLTAKWPDIAEQVKQDATQLRLKTIKQLCQELAPMDLQIIQLISNGLTSKEIALELHRSLRTIEGRRSRILKLTNCVNTGELISKAKEKGWCQ